MISNNPKAAIYPSVCTNIDRPTSPFRSSLALHGKLPIAMRKISQREAICIRRWTAKIHAVIDPAQTFRLCVTKLQQKTCLGLIGMKHPRHK